MGAGIDYNPFFVAAPSTFMAHQADDAEGCSSWRHQASVGQDSIRIGTVSHATEFLSKLVNRLVTGMQEHAAFFDAPNKPSDLELY